MAVIMRGKQAAEKVMEQVRSRVEALRERGIMPCLAVILVGNDPASAVYVANKQKACIGAGIRPLRFDLPENAENEALSELIRQLNTDPAVHGILLQLPLPPQLDTRMMLRLLSPEKDVDGFSARIDADEEDFAACTPAGILALLQQNGISPAGKHCVIVGRSNIVGKPLALLLLRENATVTVCHSCTQDLGAFTRTADILISAAGKVGLITPDLIKEGAAVIDVGMNRDEDGRLRGDVDFVGAEEKAAYITPVPGGVGPMTVAMLMQNTVLACEKQSRAER